MRKNSTLEIFKTRQDSQRVIIPMGSKKKYSNLPDGFEEDPYEEIESFSTREDDDLESPEKEPNLEELDGDFYGSELDVSDDEDDGEDF